MIRFFPILLILITYYSSYGQSNSPVFGIQYKPIIPASYFNSSEINNEFENFNFILKPRYSYSTGFIIRQAINNTFSFETGINYINRKFELKVKSDIINDYTTFNLRAYEIPLQSLIYIKISEKIFLNNAFGLSVNILASDIYSEGNNYTEFTQNTFKRRRIQTALIANLGAEFRTEKNKIFYLGFSLHRPWKEIARIYPKIQNFNNTSLSNAKYIEVPGNFLTIDFRYFLSDS